MGSAPRMIVEKRPLILGGALLGLGALCLLAGVAAVLSGACVAERLLLLSTAGAAVLLSAIGAVVLYTGRVRGCPACRRALELSRVDFPVAVYEHLEQALADARTVAGLAALPPPEQGAEVLAALELRLCPVCARVGTAQATRRELHADEGFVTRKRAAEVILDAERAKLLGELARARRSPVA